MVVIVAGLCLGYAARLQRQLAEVQERQRVVSQQLASLRPPRADLEKLASRLQADAARVAMLSERSPAAAETVWGTIERRLPPGITLTQWQSDDTDSIRVAGRVTGPQPLDRLSRWQKALQTPPLSGAELLTSAAAAGGWSFSMTIHTQKRP